MIRLIGEDAKRESEPDPALVKNILELIDRETDLLSRGRTSHLTWMRLRMQHLITAYIQNPSFNPAAAIPKRRVKKGISP